MSPAPFVSAVLMCCVAILPLAPVQHVHEADDHDHHELLIHSHSEPHHVHPAHVDRAGATLDDQDTVVLTLDPVFALPHGVAHLAPPAATITALILDVPMTSRPGPTPVVEPLAHSPPRAPTALRGPPSSSLL